MLREGEKKRVGDESDRMVERVYHVKEEGRRENARRAKRFAW